MNYQNFANHHYANNSLLMTTNTIKNMATNTRLLCNHNGHPILNPSVNDERNDDDDDDDLIIYNDMNNNHKTASSSSPPKIIYVSSSSSSSGVDEVQRRRAQAFRRRTRNVRAMVVISPKTMKQSNNRNKKSTTRETESASIISIHDAGKKSQLSTSLPSKLITFGHQYNKNASNNNNNDEEIRDRSYSNETFPSYKNKNNKVLSLGLPSLYPSMYNKSNNERILQEELRDFEEIFESSRSTNNSN